MRLIAHFCCAAIACLLGMGSKEVMVSAPIMILLYDRTFRARSWRELFANRRRRWYYAALFATRGSTNMTPNSPIIVSGTSESPKPAGA